MIERYALSEMGKIWSELNKKKCWLEVERAVVYAKEKLNMIPQGSSAFMDDVEVTQALLDRADEIEQTTDHDLLAFVHAVAEKLHPDIKPHFHTGLTSYDIEDTALALQLKDSLGLIQSKTLKLIEIVKTRAQEHQRTIMIGRTHGIHGEPITFGWKLLDWIKVLKSHYKKIAELSEEVAVGKISGAMGVYVLPPAVEQEVCTWLGLTQAVTSTQVISRDIHASYVTRLVLLANSLDRFAKEIRNLARTDLLEVAEFKRPGNKGSSAMPAKTLLKNPIKSENISGLASVMRGYIVPIMDCEIMWHERSLNNSSTERVVLPDVSILIDFMLHRFGATMEKLVVYPENMLKNLDMTNGLIYAQRIMLTLAEKGMPREDAYQLVEELALQVKPGVFKTENGETFRELVCKNKVISKVVPHTELERCFDPWESLRHINTIFLRFETLNHWLNKTRTYAFAK